MTVERFALCNNTTRDFVLIYTSIRIAFLLRTPYGDCVMEKNKALNPVADLETVMATTAAIVDTHLPGYRGKISLEFSQLPYPDDPRANFRGNVFVGSCTPEANKNDA
jgi:hypothetical protein